jgi:hypothetical protein
LSILLKAVRPTIAVLGSVTVLPAMPMMDVRIKVAVGKPIIPFDSYYFGELQILRK